ncbi:hypothetical protein ABC255_08750 [Neobacillus sp. 3P2-tot-E-2]|uniref:hypothetical protein n=1 Tax=Neobacillus sp. 3P2-tot-E-2 TaxID=3132212 RepID=UPI0039A19749
MFFKNLQTGVEWEVTDPDHVKRCQNDKNYEEVKQEQPKKEQPKKGKQSPKKEGE